MFDLRYHVASLAAVFLALIIGILVGVGISGPVDSAKTKFLEEQVAKYQRRLDQRSTEAVDQEREQQAARDFISETYPVLVRNRLRGKRIAVIFVGPVDRGVRSSVESLLDDSGAAELRFRRIKAPIDVAQLDSALAGDPAAEGLRGRRKVEDLGRALGQELMLGGQTPLWNSLADALVDERDGVGRASADGVVVVRSAPPQKGATSRFLLGFYSGLASAGVAAVGAEASDAKFSAIKIYTQAGLSTVDDVDTSVGRFSVVLLLAGAPSGHYGVKDSADDGVLPPVPVSG